jgi:hypothetical protein
MGFLPLPSDDELSADAVAARNAFLDEHPGAGKNGSINNLDRTLLSSPVAFGVYTGWFTLRDEVVPFLGERAVNLFSLAISEAFGAAYPAAFFRAELTASGDDPASFDGTGPQVTEAERLVIEWGTAIGGAGDSELPPELVERVSQTFQPATRLALTGYAGMMVAVCVFTIVGQVPAEA